MSYEIIRDGYTGKKQFVIPTNSAENESDYEFFAEACMIVAGGMTMSELQGFICEKCRVTDLNLLAKEIKDARKDHYLRMRIPKNAGIDWSKEELVFVGNVPKDGQSKRKLFWNAEFEERPDKVILSLIKQGKFNSARVEK